MLRNAYSLLLAALAVSPLGVHTDSHGFLDRRQNSNSTSIRSTSISPSSTTTVTSVRTTSEGTVIETPTTIVTTPSPSVSVSVSSVTSTITPPTSQGSTTGSPSVVTSASSVSYSISYSSFVTSVSSNVVETLFSTSNGQVFTATRTSATVVGVTSSAAYTLAPGASSSNSGLSESNKKIIGGVVGGVGGALLLGALGFTAWRIWGRKKNYHDDDLYDPNSHQEKMSASTDNQTNTPFQSTLDQYHRPGPVNTAANF